MGEGSVGRKEMGGVGRWAKVVLSECEGCCQKMAWEDTL